MYTLLKQLYTKHCGYPQYNIAILGLQQTGKTQILKSLKDEHSSYMVGLKQQYKPTIGLNTTQVNKNNMSFLVWDLGGKQSIRKLWQSYYPFCHGVIYLFDERISQGMQCLKNMLNNHQMYQIPILIFVRSTQYYGQVKDQLEKLHGTQMLERRVVNVQLLPHSRARLYQHLAVLYQNIHQLDCNIRK